MTNDEFQSALRVVRVAFQDGLVERFGPQVGLWAAAMPMCVLDDIYRLKPKPREGWIHVDHLRYLQSGPPPTPGQASQFTKFREVIE